MLAIDGVNNYNEYMDGGTFGEKGGDTMYYPEGVTDTDYCVLRFTARQGRFYSNFSSQTFDIE